MSDLNDDFDANELMELADAERKGRREMSFRGKHWVRPLRDGGYEFYMRSPDGQTMKGSASSHFTYRDLRDSFENHTGCVLPDPEVKARRSTGAARERRS